MNANSQLQENELYIDQVEKTRSEIIKAVESKNFTLAKEIIENNEFDINMTHVGRKSLGTPLLVIAISEKNMDGAKFLLEMGANPNVQSIDTILSDIFTPQTEGRIGNYTPKQQRKLMKLCLKHGLNPQNEGDYSFIFENIKSATSDDSYKRYLASIMKHLIIGGLDLDKKCEDDNEESLSIKEFLEQEIGEEDTEGLLLIQEYKAKLLFTKLATTAACLGGVKSISPKTDCTYADSKNLTGIVSSFMDGGYQYDLEAYDQYIEQIALDIQGDSKEELPDS